tara:strand:- start:1602 stop:2171 length:570 start_codon:yes stop_codon:yes gene_type:complete
MASLAGREISKTFKDLLHVYSGTEGEGLESGAKQIFDGEGIASAIWLSTSTLQVGDASTSASIDVRGDSISKAIKLRDTNNNVHDVLEASTSGLVEVKTDLKTKGSVTFTKAGHENLVMSAEHGTMERGDGTKGKIKLADTSVALRKENTDLLIAKEDGTIKLQNVDTLPSSPSAGDIVNYNGKINIGV